MRIVFLVFVFVTSCATVDYGVYYHKDKDDPDCYRHYGSMPGYCEQIYQRGSPK